MPPPLSANKVVERVGLGRVPFPYRLPGLGKHRKFPGEPRLPAVLSLVFVEILCSNLVGIFDTNRHSAWFAFRNRSREISDRNPYFPAVWMPVHGSRRLENTLLVPPETSEIEAGARPILMVVAPMQTC